MSDTLISGGRVIDPANGIDAVLDLRIVEGVIRDVAPSLARQRSDAIIDASGKVVAPGLIDLHAHLREPGGEDAETIDTGCRAAAAGGFTRVYAMPNTNPPHDSPHIVRFVRRRARALGGTRVHPVGCATRRMSGAELTDFQALIDAGAGAISDDGLPINEARVMRNALLRAAELGIVIFDHAEDLSLTGTGVMHRGAVAIRLGLRGIPRSSEATIVARDAALSAETGGRLHICHVSNHESVEAISHWKSKGAPLTAEVTPHHLTLTDAAVGWYNTNAKMKPPVCTEDDRRVLIEAIESGVIDCIATDHAPHALVRKSMAFDDAPFGIIGFESALAVLFQEFVVSGRWSLSFLLEKLTASPARVMGRLQQGWGSLAVGSPGDVIIFDPNEKWTFDHQNIHSQSRNSPWLDQEMTGRVVATLVDGRLVYDRTQASGPFPQAAPDQSEQPRVVDQVVIRSRARSAQRVS